MIRADLAQDTSSARSGLFAPICINNNRFNGTICATDLALESRLDTIVEPSIVA